MKHLKISFLIFVCFCISGCATLKFDINMDEVMSAPEYENQFPQSLNTYDNFLRSVYNVNKAIDTAEYIADSITVNIGYILGGGIQRDIGMAFRQIIEAFKGNGLTIDPHFEIDGEDTTFVIRIIDPPEVQEKYVKMKCAIEGIICAIPRTREHIRNFPGHCDSLLTQSYKLLKDAKKVFSGTNKLYLPIAIKSVNYAGVMLEDAPGRIINLYKKFNNMIDSITVYTGGAGNNSN